MIRWFDVLVVFGYVCCLVGISVYLSRRQTTTEMYFVAKRSIPGWAAGLSLLATIISTMTFIAYPGAAYAGNWSLIVPGLMFAGVIVLIGKIIVPFFRHSVRMSVYEYFGERFGRGVRCYASFAFSLSHFLKMGFVFYLLALTVSTMTGWRLDSIIIVAALITIFYTLVGGIEAVIWTDVLQSLILWIGILVCTGFLLFLMPNGPHTALSQAWQFHKFSLGSTELRLDKPTILVLGIYGFFYYLQRYTADQSVVQRYLVARTDKSAFRGILLGASLCIPVWVAFMFIGSLLWAFYRETAERLPPGINKADQVFPYFLVTHIPVGLAGVFVAALVGSAMSLLASDMNCLSVIGVQDYYAWLRPSSTDRARLHIGKWIVVVSGLTAAGVGLKLAHSQGSALALFYTISSILAGGLAGLFLLAFLCARAGRTAAQLGVAASLIVTIWATVTSNGGIIVDLGRWNFPWHADVIGAVSQVVLFAVGVLFSSLSPGPQLTDQRLVFWGWWRNRQQTQDTSREGTTEGSMNQ
jgi:solute:Na+ symporter, SSS family